MQGEDGYSERRKIESKSRRYKSMDLPGKPKQTSSADRTDGPLRVVEVRNRKVACDHILEALSPFFLFIGHHQGLHLAIYQVFFQMIKSILKSTC